MRLGDNNNEFIQGIIHVKTYFLQNQLGIFA